ncbi:hypothetical protein [Haloarcula salina]|uniref:Uncharacterized protein n=1 Tax=Haloarcula salina TaxID=1429914 RepID=A0AA41KLX1_9EURY|nr:hypothetical protein [Haloarcula salina]MBV0903339.1 hypothetical protein [Haloarcula salina]
MDKRTRTGGLAVLLVVWLVATAGAGAGVTYGLLSDDGTASGTVQIAAGSSGPPSGQSFDDANGNGQYDPGETTYSAAELVDFDDPAANLVVPESVDSIDQQNSDVRVRAGAITYGGSVSAQNGDVSLTAVDGDVTLDGGTLDSQNGAVDVDAPNGGISLTGGTVESQNSDVTLSAGDAVNVSGTDIDAQNGNVQITTDARLVADGSTIEAQNSHVTLAGRTVSARNADLFSRNNYVGLSATRNGGGSLDVTGASLASQNNDVTLESNGDILANESTMESTNGAVTADLGTATATLYLDGANVDDGDDAIAYGPTGVHVVPSGGPATPS